MITLSKSGNTVTFTFDENSGYLQNGTIDVPVNSLSLVIDDSDMATFRKSASNDIFISARYEEFGMTKAQLEAWYKANMVDSITEEEIQDMIDTSTANYFDNAVYDSGTTMINFYHGNTVKASIDASQFVIDGMIDDVRIETISGVTYLVIDFNTASGKEDIQIPLTDIFDPSNYYTKQEVDESISGKVDTSAYTAYTSSTQTTLNRKLGRNEVRNELDKYAIEPVQGKVLFNELRISALTMDDGCDTIEECVDILENNADDWTYDEGASEYRSHYCPSYLRKVDFTISADTECYGYVGVQDSHYNGIVHVDFHYYPAITDPDDPSYPQDAHIDDTDLNVEVNNDDFEPLSSSTFSVSGATITLEIPNFKVYDEWEGVYKYFNWADDTGGDALRYQLYNNVGESVSGAVTASASGAVVTYTPVKDVVEDVEESLSGKQDTLSAGTNITISGNVISASGGISSGDVQTMIDSSISGKVDTSAFTAYSSSTQATLNGKLNRSEVLNRIDEYSILPVQSRILYNELNITETAETTVFDINFTGSSRGFGRSTNCPPKARTITYEISGNSQASIHLGFSEISYTDINQESKYVDSQLILNYYPEITDPDDPQYPRNAYLEYDRTEENGDGVSAISAYTISGASVTVTLNTITSYGDPDYPELVEWVTDMLTWDDGGDWQYGDSYGNVTAVAISEPTIVTTITPLKDKIALDEEVTAAALNGLNENKLDASAYTPTDLSNYYTKSETSGATQIQTALDSKVDNSTYSAYTASTDSRLAEDEEVTAAGLNAVNSALGGIKLQQITQSAYDALTTKDPSTLYIIVN